jgi:hypothetical protein
MFTVRVADNFHYMDESETYTHGDFATYAEAVAAAEVIVDRCLAESFRPGMAAAELLDGYLQFGDDPFIVPEPEGQHFSAREYARRRCGELCGGNATGAD